MSSLRNSLKAGSFTFASILLIYTFLGSFSEIAAGKTQKVLTKQVQDSATLSKFSPKNRKGSSTKAQNSLTAQTENAEDLGDIKITHFPVKNSAYREVSQIIKQTGFFEELAAEYNDFLAMPADINVLFRECNEENAYYDPETREIWMCYELIDYYKQIFTSDSESEDYEQEVIYAALFTFLHEIGHALIDQLELPITGKEEDAVDEFATIMLLLRGDEGEAAALTGLMQFAVDAEEEAELEEIAYWDEHSLSIQRFYNMACLVYGSNPDKFSFLVTEDGLPEERAESCEAEYEQKFNSWDVLLSPYIKE